MNIKDIKQYFNGKNDDELFSKALKVRDKVFQRHVFLRGIIEFSNVCKQNCLYCGIRRDNLNIKRYRLSPAEIIHIAVQAYYQNKGINTIVLQSGEDAYYDPDTIAFMIENIKKKVPVAITLSLGEHDKKIYKLWKDAGADRYLLKIETFDENNYKKLRPDCSIQKRLELIYYLKELKYEVGSGIIIGLLDEDIDYLAESLIKLRDLSLDMIGCGPFIPHPDTPLWNDKMGSLNISLRYIALLRIMNPAANIPATSALATIHPDGRYLGLMAGANVIMPSITPKRKRLFYDIYPGKNIKCDCVLDEIDNIVADIKKAGLTVELKGVGESKKNNYYINS